MKVFKGLDALYKVFMCLTLSYIIDKTFEDYGIDGLFELLDFINDESL